MEVSRPGKVESLCRATILWKFFRSVLISG